MRIPLNLFSEASVIELNNLVPGAEYSLVVNSGDPESVCKVNIQWLDDVDKKAAGKHVSIKAKSDKTFFLVKTNCDGKLFYLSISRTSPGKPDLPASSNNNHNPPPAITTNTAVTPTFLVQNILIGGNCFNVSGATFAGQNTQRGTFANGTTSVGFSTGVILATGNISVASGPNNNVGADGGFGFNPGADPDLDALTGGNLFDVAKLEFNFIPTVDTISFEYVFASEEYCDFVGSIFNDVFGFFISGPGITGTQNIATLPGTGTYVSINNVNHNTNPLYYRGNIPPTGAASTQLGDFDCFGHPTTTAASVSDCQFDGYTTVLTAKRAVQPCQTYHIKLAIADVGDGAWDSAVFLKSNSFDAGGFATGSVVSTNPGGVIYEGCGGGSFVFVRQGGDINQPLTITYTINPSSTATSGADYVPITTTITIPAGQSSVSLPVNVILDNIPEGAETITLVLSNPCQCSQEEVTMVIQDPPPVNLTLSDVVTCGGGNVTLTPGVSGGVQPLSYSWSTNQNTGSISVSQSGTYTVTVTDACGSTQTADAEVTIESAPTALIGGNLQVCNGTAQSGTMSVGFTGTGPWEFVYSINNVPQPAIITSSNPYEIVVNQPGTYQLVSVGYPGGACPGQVSGSGNVTTATLNLNTTPQDAGCAGAANGSISLSVSGGTSPYDYQWSNGLPNQANQSGLPAGTYTVTVTDLNGCTNTISTTIDQAPPLNANVANSQDISCVQSGSANISVSGGSPGYSYQWNNGGGNSPNPGNLAAGSYTVTVTDNAGCTTTAEVTINENTTPPLATANGIGEINCNVSTIQLNSSGSSTGTGISYQWSGGGIVGSNTGPNVIVNQAGTYTITVTDASNGCTATDNITISGDLEDPVSDIQPPLLLDCNTTVQQLDATGSDSGAGYTFQWSPNVTIGQNTLTPTVTNAGTYTITVTDTNNGCTSTESVTVSQNITLPTVNIATPPPLTCTATTLTISGNGSSTGPNYTYIWTTPDGSIISGDQTLNPTIGDPGTYILTIYNNQNGCEQSNQVTVNEDITPPVANAGQDAELDCITTSVNLSAGGSSGSGLSYSWSASGGGNITGGANSSSPSVNGAGTYTVTVTNATNGCTDTDMVQVTENVDIPDAIITPPGIVTCTDPLIAVDASGSTTGPGITYQWSGNGISGSNSGISINVNQGGIFTVTVTNTNNGCTSTDQVVVPEDQVAPNAEAGPAAALTCTQSQVNLSAPPSNLAGGNTIIWTTSNGNIVSGANSLNPLVSQAGTYTLVVTNPTNGCTAQDNVVVTTDANIPVANAGNTQFLTCDITQLTLSANGSSAGGTISYSWTTTDGNIVNGANTANPSINMPGIYTLNVLNTINGCVSTDQVYIGEDVLPPIVNAVPEAYLDCINTSVNLSSSGSGSGNLSFVWSASNGGNIVSGTNTSSPLVNAAGNYIVTVTDNANGCTSTDIAQVFTDYNPPVALIDPPGTINCDFPILTMEAAGSSTGPEFTYQWSTIAGNIIGSGTGYTISITQGGIYTVTVTNTANGCSSTATIVVPEDQVYPEADAGPDALLTCTENTVTLNGSNSTSGAGLVYSWSTTNGNIVSGESTLFPTVSLPGTYTLQVTNANNGCSVVDNLLVTVDANVPTADAGPALTLSCDVSQVALQGGGSSGPGYTYSWSTTNGNIISGADTESPMVNAPGTYILTVYNALNGCEQSDQTIVNTDYLPPVVNAGPDNSLDCTSSSININGSASGAGNVSMLWTASNGGNIISGSNSSVATVNAAGTYTLLVTNLNNGCTAQDVVVISNNTDAPVINIPNPALLTCSNTSVNISSTVTGPGSNFSYSWSTSDGYIVGNNNTANIAVNQTGSYQVQVTDTDNGCSSIAVTTVGDDFVTPTAIAGADQLITCSQSEVSLNAPNPGSGMTYLWTTTDGNIVSGANTLQPTVNQGGTYIFSVTNTTNGCTGTDAALVQVDANIPVANAGTATTLNCQVNSIQLSGSASGGNNLSYAWTTTDGFILTGANTLTPMIQGPGTYLLSVTNLDNDCVATSVVNVNQNIQPPIAAAGSPQQLTCTNPSVSLNGNASSSGPNFTYLWTTTDGNITGGESTTTPIVNSAGTYTIVVTNQNNHCTASSAVVVTQDAGLPVADAGSPQMLNCTTTNVPLGGNNTSSGAGIVLTWTNASGNNIGSSPTISVSMPGIYNLNVLNSANGCVSNDAVEVMQNTNSPVVDAGPGFQLSCTLQELSLNASATGNTQHFVYNWNTPNGNIVTGANTLTPLIDDAGNYQLIVTDTTNGCASSDNTIVTQDTNVPQSIVTASGNFSCDISSVTLNGTASSQGANYTFSWSTTNGNLVSGTNTYTPVVNQPGIYTLEITDITNNCVNNSSVNITIDTLHPQAITNTPLLTCNVTSAQMTCNITSAGTDHTIQWQEVTGNIVSGANTTSPVVDQAGIFTLNIENNTNGCSTQMTVEVFENTVPPIAEAGTANALNCIVNQVSLDGTGSSAGPIYQYEWSDVITGNIISNIINPTVSAAGTYELTVLNSINGCFTTDTVVVATDVQLPVVAIQPASLLTCINTTVQLNGSGSSSGSTYSYQWTTVNGNILNGNNSLTPEVNAAGDYQLLVTNTANLCTNLAIVAVGNDLTPPDVDAGLPFELTCTNTQTTLNGSSTTGNVSYSWTTSNGNILSGQNTANPVVNAQGDYQLLITNNNNGCTAMDLVTVTQDANVPVSNAGAPQTLTCAVTTATLNGSGSSSGPNYSYNWSTSDGNILSGQSSLNPVIGSAGVYSLMVTDMTNNCTSTSSVIIGNNVTPPIASAGPGAELTCTQETLTLDASASVQPNVVYNWSTLNGIILSGQNTVTPVVGAPGTYTLQVTSLINGCNATSDVLISQSTDLPVVNIANPNVLTCSTQSINLDATQSSTGSNYNYQWTTNNGSIVTGSTTMTPEVNAPGTYQLVITDISNGCDNVQTITVDQDIAAPQADAGNSFILNCTTSSTTLNATANGSGSLAYSWTTLDGNIISGGNTLSPVINEPGTYLLSVTDLQNGCITTDPVTINEDVNAPDAVIASPGILTCNINQIVLDASTSSQGGNYVYNWTTTGGNITDTTDPLHPVVDQTGSYQIQVTNTVNGCTETYQVMVTANTTAPLVDAGFPAAIECDETSTSLAGSASGGGALNIIWNTTDGQIISGGAGLNPTVGMPGTYVLQVTDLANGCTAEDMVAVSIEAPPVLEAVKTEPPCFGLKGLIEFTDVTDGNPPFLYSIDGGLNYYDYDLFINLGPGLYPLMVLDAHGCTDHDTIVMYEPTELTVDLETRIVIEFGGSYQIETEISYPLADIASIEWTPSTGLSCTDCLNPIASPLESTTYTVVIRNQNGCEDRASVEVIVDLYPSVYVPNVFSPNDDGNNDIFTIFAKDPTVKNIKSFLVYDRWGETVHEYHDFQPNQPVGGWDGKYRGEPMNPQVFAWWAEVELIDGRFVFFEGDVTLVR